MISRVILTALLGALHALSFGPWPTWWLQTLSLALFFLVWIDALRSDHPALKSRSSRQRPVAMSRSAAIALPLAFSVTWFSAGLCWLFVSMHDHGGLPAPLAALAVVLVAAYLSMFPVAACVAAAACSRLDNPRLLQAAAFAAAFTLGEMARGYLFSGFPWLATGYAHVDSPLRGWAPLLGVYGVCGLSVFLACCLGFVMEGALPSRARSGRRILVMAGPVAGIALVMGSGALLTQIEWAEPEGVPIAVRLLQGNVPQQMKFDPIESRRAMRAYAQMAAPGALRGDTDLTVMPETAWTLPWPGTDPSIVALLFPGPTPTGRRHHVAIGMPLGLAQDEKARELSAEMILHGRIANSVLVLRNDRPDDLSMRYDKHHLVPFGEFVPWGFDWFVRMMRIPLGSFARGATEQEPAAIAGQRLAFNICYEDLFGEELAASVRSNGGQATVLVNVSNIAWFGNSHALPQHLQIARMRSIELARPTIRATNTGMTASIDATGTVRAVLEPHAVGVLEDQVQGMKGDTPYARFTNTPALLLSLTLLMLSYLNGRRRDTRD